MGITILSMATKVIIIGLSLIGLYCVSGLTQGKFRIETLIYFTNLSIVFCILYYPLALLIPGGGGNIIIGNIVFNIMGYLNGAVVLCVTVTMSVYNFALVPHIRKNNATYKLFSFSDIIVHYAVPTLAIMDWLFFAQKGLFSFYSPFIWSAIFLAYYFFLLIRARYGKALEYTQSRYPYYFINADLLGVKRTAKNLCFLSLAIIALGYGITLFDRLLT